MALAVGRPAAAVRVASSSHAFMPRRHQDDETPGSNLQHQPAPVMDQARKAVRPAGGGAAPGLRAEWSRRTTRHEHGRAAVLQLATSTRQRARPPGWPAAPDVPAGPGAQPLVAAPQQSPGRWPAGPPAGSGLWSDSRPGCPPRARSGYPSKAIRAQQPGPRRPWCPPAAGSPAWRLDGTGSPSKRQGAAINRSASVRSATSLRPRLAGIPSGPTKRRRGRDTGWSRRRVCGRGHAPPLSSLIEFHTCCGR